MSHTFPSSSFTERIEPQFRTGGHVRPASNLTVHGFHVSGTVAQLGSVHEGVLEFPELGEMPISIRVRATDAQSTQCHFHDLSLKQQSELRRLLALYSKTDGGDAINELSYDEIARGHGSQVGGPRQAAMQSPVAPGVSPIGANGHANVNGYANGVNGRGSGLSEREEQVRSSPLVSSAMASQREKAGVKKSAGAIAVAVLLVGIVASAAVVYLFFRSQSAIPVQNAVLLGNYIPVKSNVEGVIDRVFVKDGDSVSPGDPLFRVVDQKVEGLYVETQATLAAAVMERDQAKKAVENAKRQLEIMAKTMDSDHAVAKAALALSQMEVSRTESQVERWQPLAERRVIPVAKYDEAVMERDAARATLRMREAELSQMQQRAATLKEFDVVMVGDRVDQSLSLAESQLATAEAGLVELKARLEHLETVRGEFTVTAKQAGEVYSTYLTEGSFVKPGGEVLAVATREESWAVGHVSQKLALKVLPGQKVRVKFPSLGVSEVGEVASVGHRGIYSQSGWNPDFRAEPTLVPVKVTLPDMPYKIPAGLRIGMVIELDYKWPWEKHQPLLDEETNVQTAETISER